MRRRRTEALAELLREFEQDRARAEGQAPAGRGPGDEYEAVPVTPAPERILPEPETEELPPVRMGEDFSADSGRPQDRGRRSARRTGGEELRRAAVVVGVAAAALIGFGCALLLPGGDASDEARPSTPTPAPSAPGSAPPTQQAEDAEDPDGPGTLREGDSGPEVTELQERLRKIPNVYDNGSTSGTYDATLTEAVARFQLWYGIRGDETGVYGNDTRLDLELRTQA
jgi:hypothetical protein